MVDQLIVDLLIQIGERVLDAEDVHQLCTKRAGDGTVRKRRVRSLFAITLILQTAWQASSMEVSIGGYGRLRATATRLPVAVELFIGESHIGC